MSQALIDALNIPRELTLEFLATFARFEYALKRSGYLAGNDQRVQADWNRYGNDLVALGDDALQSVFEVAEYLEANPPLKQVKRDGDLGWALRDPEKAKIRGILLNLRTVRNNLFHGGKFPYLPVEESSRDEQLIRCCLAILNELVALPAPTRIAQHFRPEG